MAVSASDVDLMERVCQLTNKIYREMLCITRHESMTSITMGRLDRLRRVGTSSLQYGIVLSWDLLVWMSAKNRIFSSFTDFITNPDFSGPLYIRPDFYHTQITEYSLEMIYQRVFSQ